MRCHSSRSVISSDWQDGHTGFLPIPLNFDPHSLQVYCLDSSRFTSSLPNGPPTVHIACPRVFLMTVPAYKGLHSDVSAAARTEGGQAARLSCEHSHASFAAVPRLYERRSHVQEPLARSSRAPSARRQGTSRPLHQFQCV